MTIHHGDCLDVMREMNDNSIDFIITDPPYGLHFMGKNWDGRVPAIEIWAEALRVCKPGAMLAAFGGSRTHHHLMLAIEGSGWEIRDVMMWIYGSGFPKSHNKFGFEGYGTALKPAYEPIIICMKPLNGTFAHNAEKWGVAGLNIDACRVEGTKRSPEFKNPTSEPGYCKGFQSNLSQINWDNSKGRWPSNLILDEESADMLDEMTGILKTGSMKPQLHEKKNQVYSKWKQASPGQEESSGGASRFFYCAKASSSERNKGLEGMPLKESSGCYGEFEGDGRGRQTEHSPRQNTHPTVKPIALMKYIIKLLAPPGNPILLDPFAGSGSTLVAAKELGIQAIGIEKEQEYCQIATKRIEFIEKQLVQGELKYAAS